MPDKLPAPGFDITNHNGEIVVYADGKVNKELLFESVYMNRKLFDEIEIYNRPAHSNFKNLTNSTVGSRKILAFYGVKLHYGPNSTFREYYWICKCECGNLDLITKSNIKLNVKACWECIKKVYTTIEEREEASKNRYHSDPNTRLRRLFSRIYREPQCDITWEWVDEKSKLTHGEISGLPFDLITKPGKQNARGMSFCRLDHSKPHTKANTVIDLWLINEMMKRNSKEEFIEICAAVVNHNKNNHKNETDVLDQFDYYAAI